MKAVLLPALLLQVPAPQPFQEAAAALARAQRWAELRSLCEATLATRPEDPLGQTYLALVHLAEGRLPEATRLAEAAARAEPRRPLAWWVLGLSHLQAGRLPQAVDSGRKLGELDPGLAFEYFGKPALVRAMGGEGALPFVARPALKPTLQPSAPPYPESARHRGIQGDVVLDILIDGDGTPLVVAPVWGPPELVPTAVAYLKRWRFPQRTGPLRFRFAMDFKLVINPGPYQRAPEAVYDLPR